MNSQPVMNRTYLAASAGVGVILLVVVVVTFARSLVARSPSNAKDYFTTDDGKTYFADDITKGPSFEKEGKEAVRAVVFSCDGGKNSFVGYLRRGAAGKTEAETEIKRPGDQNWVPALSRPGAEVKNVRCPSGSTTPPIEVSP